MKTHFAVLSRKCFRWSILAACSLCMLLAVADTATGQIPALNTSHDPYQLYGGCGSGFRQKADMVSTVGKSMKNVTAIDVINCEWFNGGGQDYLTACPAGSPYTYCVVNHNDGLGNAITIGVLELTADNDPLGTYGGCAPGTGFRHKSFVARDWGMRNVDNIVVLDCHAADGPAGTVEVPCPTKPNPFFRCLQNHDDGKGNSVLVGVVKAYSPGDPNSLYGGCYPGKGYRRKTSLVAEAGLSLDKVSEIYVTGCNVSIGAQQTPQAVDCTPFGSIKKSYSYCLLTNNDGKGNQVGIGVVTTP